MKITKSQQDRIRAEVQRGIIISAVLTFVFASYLFRLSLRFSTTLVTMVFFFLFASAYLLQFNPPAARALRAFLENRPVRLLWPPLLLWVFATLYSILVGAFSLSNVAFGLGFCLIPALLRFLYFGDKENFTWSDLLALLIIWLPVELTFFSQPTIPLIEGVISLSGLSAIILTLYLFAIVIDSSDLGLTFRWNYPDLERAFWYFLLFVAVVGIPVGFAGQLFTIPRYLPDGGKILITIFFVYFFVALPEELVFRGILQNKLTKIFQSTKYGVALAIAISSMVFALAHIYMKHLPFFSGNAFLMEKPLVYFILSTGAGAFYGLTFVKTHKVTAAALTHALVDIAIFLFLSD